jgi:hydroxymethylpyrimidine/phosphomethylpyrimidine kinase
VIPRILIIAGSDSGGGAGIQADIKTVTMLGGHAMTAITAITAQNTLGVSAVHPVPVDIVIAQIDAVVSDIGVDAVKIGMIGSAEIANAVADRLEAMPDVPVVFDPVMIATSGSVLADETTVAAFGRLMRRATVVTPNLPELAALGAAFPILSPRRKLESSMTADLGPGFRRGDGTGNGAIEQARALVSRFGCAVLVKGGHDDASELTDGLVDPDDRVREWHAPRIDTRHNHGTGCTLASGIATGLGAGIALPEAIARARAYVRAALLAAPGLGAGHGPMGHGLGGIPADRMA